VRAVAHVPEPEEAAAEPAGVPCVKHRGEYATEQCYVCRKPICPKCMEMFGYVCSPLCKAKAESHGVNVPVYAKQKSVVEARMWRKVGLVSAAAATFIVALLGVWIWYAWFGSTPSPAFSLRFDNPVTAGMSWVGGKDDKDLVFIHGATLGRARVNEKQALWTRNILNSTEIQKQVDEQIADMKKWIAKAQEEGWERVPKMPQPAKLQKRLDRAAMEDLRLHVRDQSIWVFSAKKIMRYNWADGAPAKEILVESGFGTPVAQGDVFLFPINTPEERKIGRLDLKTGDWQLGSAGNTGMFVSAGGNSYVSRFTNAVAKGTGGLDAGKIADRAQDMSLPERLALPATLSGAINRQRVEQELASGGNPRPAGKTSNAHTLLLPDGNKAVEVSVEMLEEKMVERVAMKAAPAKSKLDSAPSVANTMEIANEILNDMRRSGGDDKIIENQSLYKVSIKDAGGAADGWTGQVNGPPNLFPLKTVHVLTCFKKVIVFDKSYKKLWENTLNYDVKGSPFRGMDEEDEEGEPNGGQGPCVERDGVLYVYDAGTVSSFDLKTGDVRWRLPSVGVYGMFFDNKGAIYLNTTTAGPDSIKYAKQIDISRPGFNAIAKVNPKNGAVLWQMESAAPISYLKDQFIYTIQSYRPYEPDEDDEDGISSVETGFEKKAYLRIKRINPKSGGFLWEHVQDRAPLDAGFDRNTIRLVFKKEVQVLHFLSF
jgi:hypothetical protein